MHHPPIDSQFARSAVSGCLDSASEGANRDCYKSSKIMKIAALALLLGGCQSTPDNRVEVTDYRLDGAVAQHFEDFEESLYSVSDDGLADIILRKTATHSQDPTQKITQIVHLQTFWKRVRRDSLHSHLLNALQKFWRPHKYNHKNIPDCPLRILDSLFF